MAVVAVSVMAACMVLATAVSGVHAQKTLVLLDSMSTKDTHSIFFSKLEGAGLHLKYSMADASSLSLEKFGERLFDNVLVFAPTVSQFGGSVTSDSIASFVDHGGNVLVAASSDIGESIANLGLSFGYEFGEDDTNVVDHFSNHNSDPLTVAATDSIPVEVMTGGAADKPVLFRGVSLVADEENSLIIPVLRAPSTSYSAGASVPASNNSPKGKGIVLVGAMQARNNARVVLSGSFDLFSNEFLANADSSNEQFASAIGLWCFGERGVLRKGDASFHLVGESNNSREFTIKDEVYYALPVEEKVNGEWVPFAGADVQLEYIRMDTFVRRTLTNSNGVQETEFTLPDVYGVFQFRVDYQRRGYSFLFDSEQVSVRPLRHTQYERFIVAAYPYYTSSFSMMIGFVVFSLVYLHHRRQQS